MSEYRKLPRTANTARNVRFGLIKTAVSMLFPFATRTVVIYRYGVDYLGLSSLFTSVLQVLNLAELGFGTAIVYSLYRPVAEEDWSTVRAYLNCYRRVYRMIGLAVLAIGLAILPFLPLFIKDKTIPGDLNLYYCFLIFLGNNLISYLLFGYLTAIPTAMQRNDLLSRVDIGIVIIKNAAEIMTLLLADSFYVYLLMAPALTVLRNLSIAALTHRRYPNLFPEGELTGERKRDLKKRVAGLFVNKLFAVSRNSIDALCISALIGLTMTGVYQNYFLVHSAVVAVSGVLGQSMIPGIGNAIVTETREKNYRDMRRFDFLYTAIGGWAAVCLACLYQPFMRLWVGERMMLGWPEVFGLSVYFYILKSGDLRWFYNEGAGLWWDCRYIALAEAAANVALNIVLARYLGVFGIILATNISLFFINFLLCPVVLFRRYFQNGKLREYFQDHLLYLITLLPGGILSFFLCNLASFGTLWGFVLQLLICTIIPGGVYYLLWHRTERCRDAMCWLRNALLKTKPQKP